MRLSARIASTAGIAALALAASSPAALGAPVVLSTAGSTYAEDLDTLASTGTSGDVPTGWEFDETGGGSADNGLYTAGTGSSNAGDTYSFGAAGSTERAFGALRSGTLIPVRGASFTNATGATITSLAIAYAGEQWRLGTLGRAVPDRLDFQISLDATSVATGTWADEDALDFTAPTTAAAAVGALDGNAAANRAAVTSTIAGLSIPDGATFFIRWTDFDATGADDGLAIDEFRLTPETGPVGTPNLSIADVARDEGDAGTGTQSFTVSLSAPAGAGGVSFDIATADGTAVAPGDYEARGLSGQVIPAGASSASFGVTVNGDTDIEPDEGFTVAVTNVVGADVTDPVATGTIRNDDTALVAIRDIQGAGHLSPLNGQTVTTQGVATALRTAGSTRGYYLQDPAPDGSDATSEGIFVFTGSSSTPSVAVGDLVRLTGVVSEFRPSSRPQDLRLTELVGPLTQQVVSSGNPLPAPVVLGAGGRTPPAQTIEDEVGNVETSGLFEPATDGIDFYESLEGMRVQVNDAVATGPTADFGSNREISVLGDSGAVAGLRTPAGGIIIRPDDFNPERIILNDWIAGGPVLPQVNVGDGFPGAAVGVIDYSFSNFKLQVASLPALTTGGLSPETTSAADPGELAVATFNVENLDPGDGAAKFDRLAGLIVGNLRAPDIVALEEIQDNNGPVNDAVVDASATYTTLIAAIAAAGGPAYEYRQIDPADDTNGGEPGGNIRVGFLFRTDRGVSFVDRPGGDSTTATTVVSGAGGVELSVSPGLVQPVDPAFASSRKPLAGEFLYRGNRLFLIANHFASKGGDQPLFGVNQPPARSSEVQRHQQARIVHDFAASITTADPTASVVVLGDINDFQFSETVTILEGDSLNTLIDTLPENERYSYVFEGNSQALDHILLSDALLARPFEYDVVHVNAEFADQASDHDPQVVRLTTRDDAPTVDGGGPYSVAEGGSLTLSATGLDREDDAAGLPLTYAWDLDDDGTFESAGQTASYTAPPRSAPASRTVAVRVTDSGGNSSTDTATIRITWSFTGFLAPVANPPAVNTFRAGAIVPVRFSLGGFQGLRVIASGFPRSERVECTSTAPVAGTERAVGVTIYEPRTGAYDFVWATRRAWAGTCRQLVVQLDDGTSHRATFRFT